MTTNKISTKRSKGRPSTREYPDSIQASAEDIAKVLINTPPKKKSKWKFLKKK